MNQTELVALPQWPEIMGIKTAAKYIDRKPDAVRQLVKRGRLRDVSPDYRVQVRKSELDAVFGK